MICKCIDAHSLLVGEKSSTLLVKESSLVNTLPITKNIKYTVVTEAHSIGFCVIWVCISSSSRGTQRMYLCCLCASKFAPEGQFRLQLASFLRTEEIPSNWRLESPLLSTHFLFTILTCAHRMRVHFCPQHWLLCHLGLY